METVNIGTGEATVNGPISFAHQFIRKLEGELATAKQELVQTVSMLHKQLCKGFTNFTHSCYKLSNLNRLPSAVVQCKHYIRVSDVVMLVMSLIKQFQIGANGFQWPCCQISTFLAMLSVFSSQRPGYKALVHQYPGAWEVLITD